MRLSEVLLRIGTALVAWMVIYAYFIWLAVIARIDCATDGGEIFRLLLFMAPIAMGAAALLRVTRALQEIHQILRWLGLPVLAIALVVGPIVSNILARVNFQGGALCAEVTTEGWHAWWAPVQVVGVGWCLAMIAVAWFYGASKKITGSE